MNLFIVILVPFPVSSSILLVRAVIFTQPYLMQIDGVVWSYRGNTQAKAVTIYCPERCEHVVLVMLLS